MVIQKSDRLGKTLAILLAVLFLVSLTITSASAGLLDPQPEPPKPPAPYHPPGWIINPLNPGFEFITPTVNIDDPR